MLPLELLNVIFGALSRDDLDALMLTNVLFRDIVLRDFAEEPLRYFHRLHIRGQQNYAFEITEGNEELCEDVDEFSRRMRLVRVGGLQQVFLTKKILFSDTRFDEDIFQVLLPFKDAWRDGRLITQRCTASASVLERAFSELFFCTDIFVDIDLHGEISQPFLSLPAVRECASLYIIRLPIQLTSDEIFEWVYADARSKKPKLLELGEEQLVDDAMDFVGQLMT
ncbi:hypothetical protein AAVH_27942, partial [Aphelenchoides avenae]